MKQISVLITLFIFIAGLEFYQADSDQQKTGISWYSLEESQDLASSGEKKVLIYMEASWCTYCKKMENEVFPKEDVQNLMHKYYYPVRLDIESDKVITYNGTEMTEQEFANSIGLTGTPTFLFIDGTGKILGKQPGFIPADVFKSLLSYVGTDAYSKVKFEKFLKRNNQ